MTVTAIDRDAYQAATDIGKAAIRLHHVIGFPPSIAARLAAVGYDVLGYLNLDEWEWGSM